MQRLMKPASVLATLALVLGACSSTGTTPAPATPTAAPATATAAPATATPAPATATPAPATETPAPATSAPATSAPATSAPATSAPATSAPATSAPASSAPAGEVLPPLTGDLTMWHTYGSGAGTEPQALLETLAAVKTANPGLNLTVVEVGFGDLFNKYQLEAATGGGPDLFVAPNDSMGDLSRNDLSLDLTGKVPQARLDATKQLAIDGSTVDGKLVQVPESLKAVAMYYNADKVTTPPATTDELIAGATAKTYRVALFGGTNALYHNFGWWGAFGGKLMDDTGKCVADTTGVSDAFKFLQDAKAAGVQFFPNYDDMANGFKTDKFDIIVDGPWAAGGYAEVVKNLGVAPMPAGPKGPALPFTGVDGWTINPNTKNADLAINFALWMTDHDNQQIFANKAYHIPAFKDIESTNDISKQFSTAVESGFPRPQVKELGGFWGNFGAAMDQIDQGADPVKAVADACAAMNTANGK